MIRTKKDDLEIIKDIIRGCNYTKEGIDIYSIKTTRFFELLDSKIYKLIVDWNCIYETFFHEMPKTSQFKNLPSGQVESIAKKINKKLKSLPENINFLIPLPSLSIKKSEIKINTNVSIIVLDSKMLKLYQFDCQNYSPYSNFINHFQSLSMNMKEGDTFLLISTKGFAGRLLGFSTHGFDPVYLFKIYVSLHLIYGNLLLKNTSDNLQRLNLFVYSDGNKLLCSPRTDGLQLINRLNFNKADNGFELINSVFSHLVNRRLYKTIKTLGIQIQNSLFWFFESQNTANHNLKTIFYVSAIDSFFKQGETKEDKISKIIAEITETVQQEKIINENLIDLYVTRNKIIHGERQLFDYLVESREIRNKDRARNDVVITKFYYDFIAKKIQKFEKSYNVLANNSRKR